MCGVWRVTKNITKRNIRVKLVAVQESGERKRSEGDTLEDLVNINLYPCGRNLRQRSVVRDLLQFWAPFVKLDVIYSALTNKGGGLNGRLTRLKQAIFQGYDHCCSEQVKTENC